MAADLHWSGIDRQTDSEKIRNGLRKEMALSHLRNKYSETATHSWARILLGISLRFSLSAMCLSWNHYPSLQSPQLMNIPGFCLTSPKNNQNKVQREEMSFVFALDWTHLTCECWHCVREVLSLVLTSLAWSATQVNQLKMMTQVQWWIVCCMLTGKLPCSYSHGPQLETCA